MARRIRTVLLSVVMSSGAAMAADTVPLPGTISPEAKAVIESQIAGPWTCNRPITAAPSSWC